MTQTAGAAGLKTRRHRVATRGVLSAALLSALVVATPVLAQVVPRVDALVAAVRPALPFPPADEDGDQPAAGGADARWFVVWPRPGSESRITVKANPLHPETQRAGAAAMALIQEVIVAAERKAQADYDRAVEEVRRTGKPTDVAGISLDDEGITGERIDADLELSIELQSPARSFESASSESPTIVPGSDGVTWMLRTPANVYRQRSGTNVKEHFRPVEALLFFGAMPRPLVSRQSDEDMFLVTVSPAPGAFAIVLRGNEELLARVLATANWAHLSR